jgi:flagellar hook protein FlgE
MGSIWTGAAALNTYSDAISVVANNIANVNTTGFKSSRTLFSDLLGNVVGSTSDGSQVGCGVSVGSVSLNPTAGGYDPTSSTMDMAVTGTHGYFQVRDTDSSKTYYTRAGAFNFDTSGYLVNEQGLRVQGWAVDSAAVTAAKAAGITLSTIPTTGSQTDIQLTDFTIPAQATSSVSIVTNLDSDTDVGDTDSTDPYFSMFKSYDATSDTLASNADYSTSVTVYDSEGTQHDLTVYYNKVSTVNGKSYWEYMVTMDPNDDGNAVTAGTSKAGVLMIGTLTFSSGGALENQTAYTLDAGATDPTSLSSWTQASLASTGVPDLSATFLSSTSGTALAPQTVSFATGLSTTAGSWSANCPSSAAGIGSNASGNAGFDPTSTENAANCTTNYATTSYTLTNSVNGYATGSLTSAYVDEDGVIYGKFTNNQTRPLWVLAMADFTNPSGLVSEGNNLYSAGTDSGVLTIGRANAGVFDGVIGSTLESSNVDLASEMVNLILYQRGFESNSKVVTTADAIDQTTLGIKR